MIILPNTQVFLNKNLNKDTSVFMSCVCIFKITPKELENLLISYIKSIKGLYDYKFEFEGTTLCINNDRLFTSINLNTEYNDHILLKLAQQKQNELFSDKNIALISFNLFKFKDKDVLFVFANELLMDGFSFRKLITMFVTKHYFQKEHSLNFIDFIRFYEKEIKRISSDNYTNGLKELSIFDSFQNAKFKQEINNIPGTIVTNLTGKAFINFSLADFAKKNRVTNAYAVNILFGNWLAKIYKNPIVFYKYTIHMRNKTNTNSLGFYSSAIACKVDVTMSIEDRINDFRNYLRKQYKYYYEDIEKMHSILSNIEVVFNFLGDDSNELKNNDNNFFEFKMSELYLNRNIIDDKKIIFICYINPHGDIDITIRTNNKYISSAMHNEFIDLFKEVVAQSLN